MGVCIGYCKFKGDCPGQCLRKSKFVDCRIDCLNYERSCDICENASEYEQGNMQRVAFTGKITVK